MKKAYIYPISGRDSHLGLYNPYLDDLIRSFAGKIEFVNVNDPSRTGLFNSIKYLFKIDYLFLNWIENVPERKGGVLQAAFILLLLRLTAFLRIKVIWTMHNKLSHSREHFRIKKKIFISLLKRADLIITHSSEGISFGEETVKGSSSRIKYIPHPVKDRRTPDRPEKKYDILIWGTIAPYKGIDQFLKYLFLEKLEGKYSILIIGKISPADYSASLESYKSDKIAIQNKFIEDDLLSQLISQSRIVLFTYSKSSILSSGVLMDSLGYGANIIAPHVGAFADLSADGIIRTFDDFPDMIGKIDDQINDSESKDTMERLGRFLDENSWNSYSDKVIQMLDTANPD